MSATQDTLACVFSYNNAALLRNCVASIRRHFPGLPMLVLDDASTEAAMGPLLDQLESESDVSVLRGAIKRGDPAHAWSVDGEPADLDRPQPLLLERERERLRAACAAWATGTPPVSRHGYFYLHQKLALRLAIERGYRYAWFIEGDMQLVAGSDDWLAARLAKFDDDPAVCQLAVQFLLRPGRFDFRALPGRGVYQTPRSYNTSGLFPLDRLRERPELVDAICDEAPAGNLRTTSYRWSRLGAHCEFDAHPVQAHVPWPEVFRDGAVTLPADTLAIQPLAGRALEAWATRDITVPPLAEYFLALNYETPIPGPPWWYNRAFTERYLDLCIEHERAGRAAGTRVVRWPVGDAAQPLAHYWSPAPGEPDAVSATEPAPPPPPRLRDRLRWFAPLVWGFAGYKRARLRAKRWPYRAFCRRVARERERVLGGGYPSDDASESSAACPRRPGPG